MARSRGTVTKVAGTTSVVHTEAGVLHCDLRARLYKRARVRLAVGDAVSVQALDASGAEVEEAAALEEAAETGEPARGVIEEVEPRRSALRRVRDFKRDQVLCANVDRVFVVMAATDPPYKRTFIDRLVVGIRRDDLEPCIVFNKLDLTDVEYAELVAADAQIYERLGFPTLLVSAATGEGLRELKDAFRGRISAVIGPSGVGKSTLLNRVCPGLTLRTGEVSVQDGRGRHTTTAAELVRLPTGGFVVDTPGLRGFGMWDMTLEEVRKGFPDVVEVAAGCRFGDCSHKVEPECAVRAAVEAEELDDERYDSYLRIVEELAARGVDRQVQRRR